MFPSEARVGERPATRAAAAMPGCQTPLMFPSVARVARVVRRLAVQPLVDQWQLVAPRIPVESRQPAEQRRAAARPVLQGLLRQAERQRAAG